MTRRQFHSCYGPLSVPDLRRPGRETGLDAVLTDAAKRLINRSGSNHLDSRSDMDQTYVQIRNTATKGQHCDSCLARDVHTPGSTAS